MLLTGQVTQIHLYSVIAYAKKERANKKIEKVIKESVKESTEMSQSFLAQFSE